MAELKRVTPPNDDTDDETFELVSREVSERLCGPGPRALSSLHQAILGTAETGERVLVRIREARMKLLRSSVRELAKRHGLEGHCRRTMDGTSLIVWLERPAAETPAVPTPEAS